MAEMEVEEGWEDGRGVEGSRRIAWRGSRNLEDRKL